MAKERKREMSIIKMLSPQNCFLISSDRELYRRNAYNGDDLSTVSSVISEGLSDSWLTC
jgi:hypothetical protein